MDGGTGSETARVKNPTTAERTSDRELVVRRTVDAPARLVFQAWTRAELFRQWWVPRSFALDLLSCELDARIGGRYRLVFRHEGSTMEFFGRYLEVIPSSRLVWTNEEDPAGGSVTTVTFDERGGKTLVVVHDLYPSKEALDAAIASGSTGGLPEQLDQLEKLLASLGPTLEPR